MFKILTKIVFVLSLCCLYVALTSFLCLFCAYFVSFYCKLGALAERQFFQCFHLYRLPFQHDLSVGFHLS